jgi:hypothetical protein
LPVEVRRISSTSARKPIIAVGFQTRGIGHAGHPRVQHDGVSPANRPPRNHGRDRDRGTPHDVTPPTPPGIRVRTTAVRSS